MGIMRVLSVTMQTMLHLMEYNKKNILIKAIDSYYK